MTNFQDSKNKILTESKNNLIETINKNNDNASDLFFKIMPALYLLSLITILDNNIYKIILSNSLYVKYVYYLVIIIFLFTILYYLFTRYYANIYHNNNLKSTDILLNKNNNDINDINKQINCNNCNKLSRFYVCGMYILMGINILFFSYFVCITIWLRLHQVL